MKRKLLYGMFIFLFIGFSTSVFAQGETCATALAIAPGTHVADGPSAGAGAANICYTGATNSDWYTYTPAASGTMDISSCQGGADTRLSVYTGNCGALVCYANTDDDCEMTPGGSAYAAELTGISVTGGTTYYIEWDDNWDNAGFTWTLTYTPPPSCPAPTAQTVTGITETTADLGWTAGGTEPNWNIEWGPTGFTPGSGTFIYNTTNNPYTLSGLTAATTYDWYVQADCDGGARAESTWTGPNVFSTSCGGIINTYPYTETFNGMASSSPAFTCTPDGSVPLTCWSNFVGEDIDWDIISGATGSGGTGPSDDVTGGGKYLYTESSSCYGSTGTVVSPEYDLSPLTLPRLSFFYHMYGATMGSMTVEYSTDGGTSWTQVWTLSGDQGDVWTQVNLTLSALAGETSVFFRWVGVTGTDFTSDMAFDQVVVEEGPTNPIFGITPSGTYDYGECPLNNYSAAYYTQTFVVENVGAGTLTVTGTNLTGGDVAEFSIADTNTYPKNLLAGETLAFDVTFGPTSMGAKTTTLEVTDAIVFRATNSVTLNGNAYVAPPRQLAGTPTTTPSIDLTWEIPLPEGELRYDDGSAESWMWVADPSASTHYFYTRFNAPVAGNLNHVAIFNRNDAAGTNWNAIMVCPDDGFGNPDLAIPYETFATPEVNSTTGEWNLLQLTTPEGMLLDEVFYVVTQWPDASSTGPFVGVDTDNSSGRCGWSSDGTTWNPWSSNFIMRAYMSSPKAPPLSIIAGSPVVGTETLPVTAILGIEKKGGIEIANSKLSYPVPGINTTGSASRSFSSYKVFRGTATGVYDQTFTGIGTTSYSDVTVAPSTTYFYAVTGVYTGGDTSAFSNEIQATSLADCPAPSNQLETNLLPTQADLSWTENGSATSWQIEWDTNGFVQGTGTLVVTTANPYTLSGLTQADTYDWYVRAICGIGDTSAWIGASTFTTPCPTITTFPFTESFETGVPPDCWTEEIVNDPGTDPDWTQETATLYPTGGNPVDGAYIARFNSYTCPDNASARLATPPLDFSSRMTGMAMSFWMYHDDGYSTTPLEGVFIQVSTDGGNTWTNIGGIINRYSSNGDGWVKHTADLSAYDGQTVQVGILGQSDWGNDCYIDMLSIHNNVPATATWTGGGSDSSWSNTANWNTTDIPYPTTNVTVPGGLSYYPTITAAAECNDLLAESGVSGDGSILGDEHLNVNGTSTVQRYITGGKWHDVSASTQGQTLNSIYFGGSPHVWLTHYNESDNTQTYLTNLNDPMDPGAGFEIWVESGNNVIIDYIGALQTADVTLTSASTPPIDYSGPDPLGYNLIGNPFASPIDLDLGTWALTDVSTSFWVWDPSTAIYKDWNTATVVGGLTDGIVPMGQGFFCQTTAATASITIPMGARVHSSQAFYKSANVEGTTGKMSLRALMDNGYDEMNIAFMEEATDGFDTYDTRKMFAFDGNASQLYSEQMGEQLSINGLPLLTEDGYSVKVGYKVGVNGEQILKANLENLPETEVFLEDRVTGDLQSLVEEPRYEFDANIGDEDVRFILHFNPLTIGIGDTENENLIFVYAFDNKLYIKSSGAAAKEDKQIWVYDMMGRTVIQAKAEASTLTSIPLHYLNGYVIVKVMSESGVETTKVFIK